MKKNIFIILLAVVAGGQSGNLCAMESKKPTVILAEMLVNKLDQEGNVFGVILSFLPQSDRCNWEKSVPTKPKKDTPDEKKYRDFLLLCLFNSYRESPKQFWFSKEFFLRSISKKTLNEEGKKPKLDKYKKFIESLKSRKPQITYSFSCRETFPGEELFILNVNLRDHVHQLHFHDMSLEVSDIKKIEKFENLRKLSLKDCVFEPKPGVFQNKLSVGKWKFQKAIRRLPLKLEVLNIAFSPTFIKCFDIEKNETSKSLMDCLYWKKPRNDNLEPISLKDFLFKELNVRKLIISEGFVLPKSEECLVTEIKDTYDYEKELELMFEATNQINFENIKKTCLQRRDSHATKTKKENPFNIDEHSNAILTMEDIEKLRKKMTVVILSPNKPTHGNNPKENQND